MAEEKKINILPLILTGIAIGTLIKFFIFDFLRVSGSSMENTIHDNSVICVSKISFGIALPFSNSLIVQWKEPKRNDIIIYLYDNKIVVKRCVAVAGDSLDYSADSQYILFTGGNEIALTAEQYDCMKNSAVVPEGYVLAIGHNYSQSIDSRTYGFVPVKNILGKVLWK